MNKKTVSQYLKTKKAVDARLVEVLLHLVNWCSDNMEDSMNYVLMSDAMELIEDEKLRVKIYYDEKDLMKSEIHFEETSNTEPFNTMFWIPISYLHLSNTLIDEDFKENYKSYFSGMVE